jgi:hypothetical protein
VQNPIPASSSFIPVGAQRKRKNIMEASEKTVVTTL